MPAENFETIEKTSQLSRGARRWLTSNAVSRTSRSSRLIRGDELKPCANHSRRSHLQRQDLATSSSQGRSPVYQARETGKSKSITFWCRRKTGIAPRNYLSKILDVRCDPCGNKPAAPPAQTPPPTVSDISDEQWRQYRAQGASVYVNDSLTIDCVDSVPRSRREPVSGIHHYCFRVSDAAFDAILERVNSIGPRYWSTQELRETDCKINTPLGDKGFYFTEPDGHSWEILTVSYARSR